jgi:hypothetical protein
MNYILLCRIDYNFSTKGLLSLNFWRVETGQEPNESLYIYAAQAVIPLE